MNDLSVFILSMTVFAAIVKALLSAVKKRGGSAKVLNDLAIKQVQAGKGLPRVPIRDVKTYQADHETEVDTKDGPDNWLKRQLMRETGRDWLSKQAQKDERGGWLRRQVARESGDWLFKQSRKESASDWLEKQREKEKHSFKRIYGYDEERDILKEKQANAMFLRQIHAAESDVRRMLSMEAPVVPAPVPNGNEPFPGTGSVYDDLKWAVSEFFRKR